jgi:hypothetical protein
MLHDVGLWLRVIITQSVHKTTAGLAGTQEDPCAGVQQDCCAWVLCAMAVQ